MSTSTVRRVGSLVSLVLFASLAVEADDSAAPTAEELAGLLETYRHLHAHPELSYEERETSAFVAAGLESLGLEVTTGVGRYRDTDRTGYGVVGVLHNGEGPTIMLRTDLDGLPIVEETGLAYASRVRATDDEGRDVGVMHACGHDMHMTVFLGAAGQLVALRDQWSGTLVMVGQPAEERGAGAQAMLDDRLYERFGRPDAAIALHVIPLLIAGSVGVVPGYAMAAVDSVDITVRGVGGHGAMPHATIDPVVVAARIVVALQTLVSREVPPQEAAVVTVGSIHGGTKRNIIPSEVVLELTVRSFDPAVRRRVLDGIERISRGVALSAGVPEELAPDVRVYEDETTPALFNDPDLVERLMAPLQAVVGEDGVFVLDRITVGEDFARYMLDDRSVPTMMFWLGSTDPAAMKQYIEKGTPIPINHSSRFAPLPEPTIRTGVQAMTAAALELFDEPDRED